MPHDTDPSPVPHDSNNPNNPHHPEHAEKPAEPVGEPAAPDAFSFDDPVPTSDHDSFTVGVPHADVPELSGLDRGQVPPAQPGSDVDLGKTPPVNFEPLGPLTPASGWLGTGEMSALPTVPPAAAAGSSDIFGGPVPTASAVDQSDVIAATAHTPTDPAEPNRVPPTDARRGSDVALPFNEPPGGSTVQEVGADDDLPWAEEFLEDDEDLVFAAEELSDELPAELPGESLTEADELPAVHLDLRDDRIDTGENPLAPDAESILGDLDAGDDSTSDESSAIRLEVPGRGRSPDDQGSQPSGGFDLTVGDEPAVPAPKSGTRGPTPWPEPAGADLFADGRSSPEFDLGADADPGMSPFDPNPMTSRPSITSGQSSIFSGAKIPDGISAHSGSVPVGNPDSGDEVDFSDHPRDPDGSVVMKGGMPPARGDESGAIDWAAAAIENDPTAGLGPPPPISKTGRGRRPGELTPGPGSTDDIAVPAARPTPAKGKAKLSAKPMGDSGNLDEPSVVLDYVAGTSEMSVPGVVKGPGSGKAKSGKPVGPVKKPGSKNDLTLTKPARPVDAGKGGKGWLVGAAGGLLVGAGAFAGLYFGGVLPNGSGSGTQTPVTKSGGQGGSGDGVAQGGGGGGPAPAVTAADARAALENGDPARALQAFATVGADTPEAKAGRGQARLLARVRELARDNAAAAADDPGLKQAREDLQAAAAGDGEAAARATLFLGLSHETTGDRTGARQVYQDGAKKFPQAAEMFQAALDRLDATAPPAAGKSSRLTPAEVDQLAAAAALLVMTQAAPEAAPPAPPEAGAHFWKAVNAAAGGKYKDAIEAIDRAKAAHEKRSKALAGRGLNPTTDPLEQIFPRCCDDLKAYWTLRKSLYEHPSIGPLANKSDLGAVVVDHLAQAEKRAADAPKLAADLKAATDKLKTAEADAKTAADKLAAAEKDLKTEKEAVVKLDKDVKAAVEEVKKAQKEVQDAKDKIAATDKELQQSQAVVGGIVKELQAAKLLPEKYDAAGLIAAQKEAVTRATGPNLATLLPSGPSAVGGAGLAAGQLVDLAQRIGKAEAAVKAADTKLAAETKKLRDDHAAEMKRLTDAGGTVADKLKEAHAAEIKKLNDKLAADLKKADAAHAKEVADLKAAAAAERDRATAMAKKFEADLGNAVSPSAALDLYLELLVGLRRPADADAAVAAAQKVLATAPADSEDAAKAHAVIGVAQLVKGDTAEAGRTLGKARAGAGYRAAAGKPWAKAADAAAAAVDDPLAPIRRPLTERKDPDLAARYLDAGITAYRAGRFADAEAALTRAAFNDPADPRTWYFLGAARWQQGNRDQARADFKQGSERERTWPGSSRTIGLALEPIQGTARDALSSARP